MQKIAIKANAGVGMKSGTGRGGLRARGLLMLATVAVGGALMTRAAFAGDVIWDAGASGGGLGDGVSWNTTSKNWTGFPWLNANNDYAAFPPDTFQATINVTENVTTRGIAAGGNLMTLNGPGTINFTRSGVPTLNSTLGNFLVDVPASFRISPNTYITVNANVVSTVGAAKFDSGTVELGGTNSFTGQYPMYAGETPTATTAHRFVNFYVGQPGNPFGFEDAGTVKLASSSAIQPGADIGFANGFLDIGSNNLTVNHVRFVGISSGLNPPPLTWNPTSNGYNGVAGTGTLKIQGEISHGGGGWPVSISTPVDMDNKPLVIRGAGSGVYFMGPLTNGSLLLTAGPVGAFGSSTPAFGSIGLLGNNTYTGPTYLNGSASGFGATGNVFTGTNQTSSVDLVAAILALRTVNGSLGAATTINLLSNSTLVLDNNATYTLGGGQNIPTYAAGQNNNRLNDNVAITIRDSGLTLTGQSAVAASERIGSINVVGGRAAITIAPTNGTSAGTALLELGGDLTLSTRSTMTIATGAGVLGTTSRFRVLGSTPAATTGGLIPKIATSTDFVTYDPIVGFTPVLGYVTNFNGAPTSNVSLLANTTVTASATVNALRVASGLRTEIAANQTLTVSTGMLLAQGGHTILGPGTVAFGGTPGYIFGSHTVSSAMTGSAGLINSGGTLVLAGNMSGLTGELTNNAGTLTVSSNTVTNPIVVRTGTLNLNVSIPAGGGTIRLGIPENAADALGANASTIPILNTVGAGNNSNIGANILISNGGTTAGGTNIGALTAGLVQLNPLGSNAGTQTFSGNIQLDSSLYVTFGNGGAGGETRFAGTLSGAGAMIFSRGRFAYTETSTIAYTGGTFVGGEFGQTTMIAFRGTGGSGPLTIGGANNLSVTFTGGTALPSGLVTIQPSADSFWIPQSNTSVGNAFVLNNNITFAPLAGVTVTLTGSFAGPGAVLTGGAGRVLFGAGSQPLNLIIASGTFIPTDTQGISPTTTVTGTGVLSFAPSATLTNPVNLPAGTVLAPVAGTISGGSITGAGVIRTNVTHNGPNGGAQNFTNTFSTNITGALSIDLNGNQSGSPVFTRLLSTVAVTLTGTNSFSGPTSVNGYVLRGVEGVGLSPNSNITLTDGVLEASPTYTMNLGSGPGQVQMTGRSGFSAFNGPTTVNLNGGGTLVWGVTAGFNPSSLVLNGPAANNVLTFSNPIDLNGSDLAPQRSIWTIANTNSATAASVISGVLSNGGVRKDQTGILALTASNTYAGRTTIAWGTLRAKDGVGLPAASNLELRTGGIYQPDVSVPFTRSIGQGPGQLYWPAGSIAFNGSSVAVIPGGGFDAYSPTPPGTPLVLAINGPGNTVVYDSGDFGTAQILLNTGVTANGPITWANPLQLGTGDNVPNVTLNIGTGSATGNAGTTTFTGQIFSNNSPFLTKTGPGRLVIASATPSGWVGGSFGITGGTVALAAGSTLTANINVNGGVFDPTAFSTPNFALASTQTITFNGATPLIVGGYNGTGFVQFTTASGVTNNYTSTTNAVSGAAGIIKSGVGAVWLNQTLNYTGTTTIVGGALRATQGVGLPDASPLVITGSSSVSFGTTSTFAASLQTSGSFVRPLGTGPGQVSFPAGPANVGFDASSTVSGSTLIVAIGGTAAPSTLQLGTPTFSPPGLNFNVTPNSNGPIDFRNIIDLNNRSLVINTGNGAAGATGANTTTFSGRIIDSASGTTVVTKTGAGMLLLTNTDPNAYNWSGGSWVMSLGSPSPLTGGRLAVGPGVSFPMNILVNGSSVAAVFDVTRLASGLSLGSSQVINLFGDQAQATGTFTGSGTVLNTSTSIASSPKTLNANLAGNANFTMASLPVTFGSTNTASVTLTGSITTAGTFSVEGTRNILTFATPVVPSGDAPTLAVSSLGGLVRFTATPSTSSYTTVGTFASITVGNSIGTSFPTGTVQIATSDRSTRRASVLVTSGINLSAAFAGYRGFIDLGNNDMIVKGGNETDLRAAVSVWYNGSVPIQQGIGSTVPGAGSANEMIAVFPNDLGGGIPYFDKYDGVTLAASDVIVKYTNFGDTNLDGIVDGVDLVNAIEGYTTGLTGWQHGDFNYDGVVNTLDLNKLFSMLTKTGLINYGTGQGEGANNPSGAVPEPSAALAALALAPLMGRRRRR